MPSNQRSRTTRARLVVQLAAAAVATTTSTASAGTNTTASAGTTAMASAGTTTAAPAPASAAAAPASPPPLRCRLEPAVTVHAGDADREDFATRLSGISVAADGTGAQLTFTALVRTAYDSTPWELRLARVSAGTPATISIEQPPDSAAAESPDPRAIAVAFESRLGVFSHGLRDQNSFRLVPNGGVITAAQLPTALAAASDGSRVLGASAGQEGCGNRGECADEPRGGRRYSVRSYLFRGRKGRSQLLYQVRDRRGQPAARPGELAVALGPTAEAGGAVAFVAGEALLLARTDAQGARRGELETVATGGVGQPTLTFRGDQLVIVWVELDRRRRLGSLAGMALGPGEHAAPQRRILLPTVGLASEPTLRAQGDALLLAWTEHRAVASPAPPAAPAKPTSPAPPAPAKPTSPAPPAPAQTVQLAATRDALATLTAQPLQISTSATLAGAPALATIATDATRAWIAWAEFPQQAHSGVVRAAQLSCR